MPGLAISQLQLRFKFPPKGSAKGSGPGKDPFDLRSHHWCICVAALPFVRMSLTSTKPFMSGEPGYFRLCIKFHLSLAMSRACGFAMLMSNVLKLEDGGSGAI